MKSAFDLMNEARGLPATSGLARREQIGHVPDGHASPAKTAETIPHLPVRTTPPASIPEAEANTEILCICESFGVRQAEMTLKECYPDEYHHATSGDPLVIGISNREWTDKNGQLRTVIDLFSIAFGEDAQASAERIEGILSVLPFEDREKCHSEYTENTDFPISSIPERARNFAEALVRVQGAAVVTAGALMIGVTSAALGTGLATKMVRGLTTYGNLYLLGAGKSGCGKSIVARPIMQPLYAYQDELYEKRKEKAAGLLTKLRIAESKAADLERKKDKSEATFEEAAKFRDEADRLTAELKTPRVIVDDVTAEKLAMLAHENRGVLASISSDARSAVKNMRGKYGRGDTGDEDIYLKGFSVERLIQDRVTRSTVNTTVCLTIVWLTQDDILPDLYNKDDLADSGLLCRFLPFQIPNTTLPSSLAEVQFPEAEATLFYERIRELLTTYHARDEEAHLICATREARAVLASFEKQMAAMMEDVAMDFIRAFVARTVEQCIRMAIVLQGLEYGRNAHRELLSGATMRAAAKLVRWFFSETCELFGEATDQKQNDRKATALEFVRRNRDGVSARDLFRYKQGLYKSTKMAREILDSLVEEGAIQAGEIKKNQRFFPRKAKI